MSSYSRQAWASTLCITSRARAELPSALYQPCVLPGIVVNSSWTNGRDTINTQFVTHKVSFHDSPSSSPSSSTNRTITSTGSLRRLQIKVILSLCHPSFHIRSLGFPSRIIFFLCFSEQSCKANQAEGYCDRHLGVFGDLGLFFFVGFVILFDYRSFKAISFVGFS